MLIVTAKVNVPVERQQAFIDRFKSVREKEQSSQGCIAYQVYQDPTSTDAFFVYEAWENQKDFDLHVERAPFEGFLDCVESIELFEANKLEG